MLAGGGEPQWTMSCWQGRRVGVHVAVIEATPGEESGTMAVMRGDGALEHGTG